MAVSIDLSNPDLTPDDLDQLRIDAQNELERRRRLADTPGQLAEQARRYVQDGGDLADVQAAIAAVATQ